MANPDVKWFADIQSVCPNCKSDNFAIDGPAEDGIHQLTCHDCSFQWTEPEANTTVKDVTDFLFELELDDPDLIGPVINTYRKGNMIWVLTEDKKVFRITVEEDSVVKAEDFGEKDET